MPTSRRRDWEDIFSNWGQPPGSTQRDKCDRAIKAVKDATLNHYPLLVRSVDVVGQGSYRNRVSVRQESDVDVCIRCRDTFYFDGPANVTLATIGAPPASYGYPQYKNDVEAALVDHFGAGGVQRGNKAFDIKENTYRIDADAAACFEYRLYYPTLNGFAYHEGTALFTDREGRMITNFPKQQHDEGRAKNQRTGYRYRPLVRIVKLLCNEMQEVGIPQVGPMASFLIESLVWNMPDDQFEQYGAHFAHVERFLRFIYNGVALGGPWPNWREANGIKTLFAPGSSWTTAQVQQFAEATWTYIHKT